jgi:hypothetical protein
MSTHFDLRAGALMMAGIVFGWLSIASWHAALHAQDKPAVDRAGKPHVPLYGVFERQVKNPKTYSNPFDFQVIDLKTEFKAPSGKTVSFFGFYDGDGKGGQTGHVWAFRFMPGEVGRWQYFYSWTDGSNGGSGSFEVGDTGLAGPLKVATDNSWYFMTAREKPFHARPYGMHHYLVWSSTRRMSTELAAFKKALKTRVIERGYNMVMWPDMGDRLQRGASSAPGGKTTDSWWLDTADTRRFSIAAFRANEDALAYCRDNGVYAFNFAGMLDQGSQYPFEDLRVFLRYYVARLAPYYSTLGWSPTWEWMDIWKPAEVQQIMQYVHDNDPWKRLLTAHDASHSTFTGWLGFSMRQKPARDVFGPNSRRAGYQQVTDAEGSGGVGNPFIDRPIIGSEDQWESPIADKFSAEGWRMPRGGVEAMRSSWGTLMAGVIPLYDEWSAWAPAPGGKGQGEPHVRRMFDFWYGRTRYRQFKQLNDLVSRNEGQICSGIAGHEYVVFDQNGGQIAIDLSSAPAARSFAVLWFDPTSGREQKGNDVAGGARREFTSPFNGDSVLHLAAPSAENPPVGSAGLKKSAGP